MELVLTPLAGQEVEVELTVHPGADRVPDFDWARWIRPRIEQDARGPGVLAVSGPRPWKWALGPEGPLALDRYESTQAMHLQLPATVFLLRRAPTAVTLPAALTRHQYYVMLSDRSGRRLVPHSFVGAREAESTVGGVTRGGLFAHPPDHGQTQIHWPLHLPDRPTRFHCWIGIRDGAQSTGVQFRVEVNGGLLWQRRLLPGSWQPVTVDLTAWRGQPVVLSLVANSDGSYRCDWAHWGDPRIEAQLPN
jgi:hypothetical protein